VSADADAIEGGDRPPLQTHLEELVESLLYEGYALYPYTPGATKNSTPTPFGIVYPPAYAAGNSAAFDHLQLECLLEGEDDAPLEAVVRFLQAGQGETRATERRLVATREGSEFSFDGLEGRVRMDVEPDGEGTARVRVCVHNTTALEDPDLTRGEALQASLMSTHVIVTAPGSRFRSPLDTPELRSVNTFPVLATPDDDTVLAATIMLPDHPQLAPESRGNLFDGTEIEEALLLHVHALSDGEREAIQDADPAVRAMVERAAAATPEEMLRLHGRLEMRDPVEPD